MFKKLFILIGLLAIASLALAACQPPETVVEYVEVVETVVVEGEVQEVIVTVEVIKEVEVEVAPEPAPEAPKPVTMNWVWTSEPPTADPSLATDNLSINLAGNLFVSLTTADPVTFEPLPYLASSWEPGEDEEGNQTWTFHLRDDFPWVHYDPVTGETTQVVDGDGNPRFVNAHDVEYGVKRTLDPATASDYSYVLYAVKNGAAVNAGEEGFTLDDVGVAALDDWTVQFTLENPAGYFPSIATMWIAYPMPQWNIEAWGSKWNEPGLMDTSGPYMLESWIHGGTLDMVKNPLFPMADEVQIERIEGVIIEEESTAFALYENNEVDSVSVPLPEIDRVKADPVLSAEFTNAADVVTYYYGFTNTKPPFDDHRVRKAFSMAIDRQSLIDNVTKGGQLPATSFAPPGIFGAPPPGEVGLGYDPEAAVAYLQEYLDENGLTLEDFNAMDIVLMHNTSEGHAAIAAAIQQMWKDVLGVDVRVENQEWKVYLQTIKNTTPVEDMPHIWRLGWGADYADENNWVHEVFNALAGANRLRRGCVDPNCGEVVASEFDNLTVQAGQESDPTVRAELYREAERILAEEETAYAPIYHYSIVNVSKPWLTRNFPGVGQQDFWRWTIDWDAKMGALGQ